MLDHRDTPVMSLPEIVQSTLGDEPVAAEVDLGGEDALLVTPTRTLVYRAEGLLSDETVTEYGHGAERIEVSEGRRKSKISLDYGLDGTKKVGVPTKRLDEALHPVIAGILNAAGITDAGETVTHTFRFSELTLVITSDRLVKHIGAAVWDDDYEEFHYDDVTDLTFEEGSVATSVVLRMGNRQERFKAPNEEARAVREGLTSAILSYYDVQSLEEFRQTVAPEDEGSDAEDDVEFGDGPTPLSTGSDEDGEAAEQEPVGSDDDGATVDAAPDPAIESNGAGVAETASGVGRADETGDLEAELAALREAVEAQTERIERQEKLIEQLIAELRQGR
jgi:hypothetical protein